MKTSFLEVLINDAGNAEKSNQGKEQSMEENKAKTTETEEMLPLSRDGADADAVTSEGTVASSREATSPTETAREVNRENARRRREEERLRQLAEERERAIIETLDGKNPFDGSEMHDSGDVERFLLMNTNSKAGSQHRVLP